jgi:hypothetical protein
MKLNTEVNSMGVFAELMGKAFKETNPFILCTKPFSEEFTWKTPF